MILCGYIAFIMTLITGIGCSNYLWIAITGRSFIRHTILLSLFGIVGIIMIGLSIWGLVNIKTIL